MQGAILLDGIGVRLLRAFCALLLGGAQRGGGKVYSTAVSLCGTGGARMGTGPRASIGRPRSSPSVALGSEKLLALGLCGRGRRRQPGFGGLTLFGAMVLPEISPRTLRGGEGEGCGGGSGRG